MRCVRIVSDTHSKFHPVCDLGKLSISAHANDDVRCAAATVHHMVCLVSIWVCVRVCECSLRLRLRPAANELHIYSHT